MIVGFLGRMGSGKTLSLTRQVYKEYKKGKKIISNMHFNFVYTPLTLEMLLQYDNENTQLHDTVIVIDEAHVYLDSRTSVSKRNRIISLFLTQTRKKNVHLYYTTQSFDQVDKRLRNNSDVLIVCKTLPYKNGLKITYNTLNIKEELGFRVAKTWFISNKFFNLYDTSQVISIKENLEDD